MRFDSFYKNVLPIILLFLFLAACKQKTETVDEGTEITKAENVDQGVRATALALIQHRAIDGKTYAIMTEGFWNYEFVFDKGMSEPGEYAGHYLNFNDDFTYEYGIFDDIQGRGQYHYRLDDSMLIMLDNNGTVPPKEWEVKYGGDAMVLVGSHGFGNNGMQIKMLHTNEKPVKE